MPKQVLPTKEAFEAFREELSRRGFRPISSRDVERRTHRRIRPLLQGKEAGFIYQANGLSAIIWTTFVEEEGEARKTDAGWGVICDEHGKALYFTHPISRTKNYLSRLLMYARILRYRVRNRPECPVCSASMHISRNKRALKARYWSCVNRNAHRKPHFLPWDYDLPSEALVFLKRERRKRERYRMKLFEKGKNYGVEMLRRSATYRYEMTRDV